MAVVETTYGRVEGETRGEQYAFRGIPFAKPPVGRLRFLPPQAPEPWSGTRAALEFAPSAPQMPSPFAGLGADGPQSEDCLYLNVFTPGLDDGRRPVLFWIHGGAFIMGSGGGPLYDGKNFVTRGDVVVVTINYRLGAFGYLPLGEHGGDAWGATANAGQLDQIAALEWVRDNIARFGGDPENVTIFGESAGSFAVTTLLAMPGAQRLFHKAIGQSGASFELRKASERASSVARLMDKLGIADGDSQKLQDVPADVLLANQLAGSRDGLAAFFPVVDGKTVPQDPQLAIARGEVAQVPLVLGTNRDEMNLFMAAMLKELDKPMEPQQVAAAVGSRMSEQARGRLLQVLEIYRASRQALSLPAQNRALMIALTGDVTFRIPATRYADAFAAHQPATYMYLFQQESPAMRGALRSCHAMEIPFVFGTIDAPMQDRFAGAGPEVERLSQTMMDAWIAFARSGNPSTPQLGWEAYDSGQRATMIFDASPRVENAPLEAERAAWDGVL
ncbi:MAG: carboxylesterase/lipase family protein [Myxococcales bacterium]|nr:carboxylesterase/lipase family protein [Myxococcales bacterium]